MTSEQAERRPTDPCIHGPGVANCGHPDCVGERDYASGLLIDFSPDSAAASDSRSPL